MGFYKVARADIGTPAQYVRLYKPANYVAYTYYVYNYYKDALKHQFTTQRDKCIIISKDDGVTFLGTKPYGIPYVGVTDALIGYCGETNDGWGIYHLIDGTSFLNGAVIWVKFK
jgi:hypothetical protein